MHLSIGIGEHQLAAYVERKTDFLWLASTKLFCQISADLDGLLSSNS